MNISSPSVVPPLALMALPVLRHGLFSTKHMTTAKLILKDGTEALIDAELEEFLSGFQWRVMRCNTTKSGDYNYIATGSAKNIRYLHRVVTQAKQGEVVDHINGDWRDNRKSSLRVCTHSQNMMNRKRHVNNTAGFKGVYYANGKFCAAIKSGGVRYYLGRFLTAKEAGEAYANAAIRLHKDFVRA